MTTVGYWYEHTNGTRIWKPAAVVDFGGAEAYFDSPFVKRWWRGTRDDSRTPEEIYPDAPVCRPCGLSCRLTDGQEVYPHRPDLHEKPMWKCDRCFAYVGCHPNTTKPLGFPAGQALRTARSLLHERKIDPLWKRADRLPCYQPEDEAARKLIRNVARTRVYAFLAARLGIPVFHTGEATIEQCRAAWKALEGVTYQDIREWWKATKPAKEEKPGRAA